MQPVQHYKIPLLKTFAHAYEVLVDKITTKVSLGLLARLCGVL